MESIIETYGYLAILISTFLEGETILILGGFAAHRGYLTLPLVMVIAFAGSMAGDQLYFYLGRSRSEPFLRKHSSWRPRLERSRTPLLNATKPGLCLDFGSCTESVSFSRSPSA